jgi:hypothetical protein
VAAADVEGGPSEEVLRELGLAGDEDEDEQGEGLVVPGGEPEGGDPDDLVVPGQD